MNSTEQMEHAAEVNNHLLFPALFKQAWGIFKKKWGTLFTLSLIPIIFLVSAYAIVLSTIYIVMKFAGSNDLIMDVYSVFHFAPQYVSAIGSISGIVIILGTLYFALRSTIASIKVLESESAVTVRHAWHGVSFKAISSLFAVLILLGIILAGGYIMLFIPVLFLITFYSNVVFTNIIEGKKGIDALVLSRQYVKGYGAIVFVNYLVIFGIGILFGLLFRFALGLAGVMVIAVYFGKFSILTAVLIALAVIIIGLLLLVLWKAFALVVVYSMFKKLQAMKAHHVINLSENRKTVKVWIILSVIALAIFIGVTAAVSRISTEQPVNMTTEPSMMYRGNSNYMQSGDTYGNDNGFDYGQEEGQN